MFKCPPPGWVVAKGAGPVDAARAVASVRLPGLVAGSAATGLALALVAIAAAGPWQSGQRTAERRTAAARDASRTAADPLTVLPPLPARPVLAAPSAARAPQPSPQGAAAALAPLFGDPALGSLATGYVEDAATGRELYARDADTPATPASTLKIGTAIAALETLGPDYRISTSVVPGASPGEIVLVGGGDPTLTAAATPPGADPDAAPASLADLADQTARSLRERGTTRVRLAYDTSRYTGPVLHPIGVNDNISPVTALMADEGRTDPASIENAPRYADPADFAARTFAGLLRRRGIVVDGDPRPDTAPQGSEALIAEVRSMTLSALVERMLTNSDNDIAEALARQTAIGLGKPASFAGGAAAVRQALAGLGLPLAGARILDGSGLDRDDRITARLVVAELVAAAAPAHPELRPVFGGLPVAGFSGTLADRFRDDAATGLVHAKTGTLTGVNSLAGVVVDADGRLLAFAFLASGTEGPDPAMAALDRLALAVSGCGCR